MRIENPTAKQLRAALVDAAWRDGSTITVRIKGESSYSTIYLKPTAAEITDYATNNYGSDHQGGIVLELDVEQFEKIVSDRARAVLSKLVP